MAEALRGLVASFADISDVQPARVLERLITAGSDADLLAASLHGLRCEPDATGRWSASMTIDV